MTFETSSLLTLEEVRQLLRFSKSKLYQECKAGNLRTHRFGRSVRVAKDDLDQFIRGAGDHIPTSHANELNYVRN